MNILQKFRKGLFKSSQYLTTNIINSLKVNNIDDESLEEIESVLLSADLGVKTTSQLIEKLKQSTKNQLNDYDAIFKPIASELTDILKELEKPLLQEYIAIPQVLIFVGVNGCGKTTSIGKLIYKLKDKKKLLVAACDTFRAAAIDQLKEWSDKNNVDFITGNVNQDPASVAFQACLKAKNENYDYLFIDTAGRLSNNVNLINQLVKIKSVIQKSINKEQIKNILVLDGTNGSNMMVQVETFGKAVDIHGLIITKLDGTAKGGAIISIAKDYQIPIHFIGLGEKEDDLHIFDAKTFSYSLLNLNLTS